RARFMRRAEPNWLIRTRAPGLPLMFRKSRAGPPFLLTRSAISVISRLGLTSVAICFNSLARSSAAIHSRRLSYAKPALLRKHDYKAWKTVPPVAASLGLEMVKFRNG